MTSLTSFHGRILELRNNPDTERAGLKWLKEEDDELLEQVNNKIPIDDIAKIHKRTSISIKMRIMQHTINLINTDDNISIENACNIMNIDIDEFKKFKETKDAKNNTEKVIKKDAKNNTEKVIKKDDDKYMNLLMEIRDLLIIISKK